MSLSLLSLHGIEETTRPAVMWRLEPLSLEPVSLEPVSGALTARMIDVYVDTPARCGDRWDGAHVRVGTAQGS
jgi:hypothetical protein